MLNILGWILHSVITIAVGLLGFSWEPRENGKSRAEKLLEPAQKERSYSIPDLKVSAPEVPHFIAVKSPAAEQNCAGRTAGHAQDMTFSLEL
ncbi:MAG TPA: hypothetical protein ENK41_05535 [Rhodobacteraceae bacterium]|nr:hypothetical protein [Paracoccaceae bacterium]